MQVTLLFVWLDECMMYDDMCPVAPTCVYVILYYVMPCYVIPCYATL